MYHMIAFVGGFLLDLLLGDPYTFPHPVRLIGRFIAALENHFLGEKGNEKNISAEKKRAYGCSVVMLVCLATFCVTAGVLAGAYWLHPMFGCVVELLMTYQALALCCLCKESKKVYRCLKRGTLEDARYAVSMIVGRDTNELSDIGVAKAAIETVAENTSDGEIAPLLYLALGGPVLGFTYKAINTMDSMIGYKNERYLDFGRCAAKLDDVVNYIPARISAYCLWVAAALMGKNYNARRAWRIYKRDRDQHASPNAAHTEAMCAGALGIRLAGDASYFGKVVKKPYLGDDTRPIVYEDILHMNRLAYGAAIFCLLVCVTIMAVMMI